MSTDTMPRTMFSDFLHYLSTGEDPHAVISADLEGDMNFPHSTFRLRGKAEFDQLRAQVSNQPWSLRVEKVEPTATGFLAVIDIDTVHEGPGGAETDTSRTISTVTVDEGRITRLAHWCTGQLR